MKVRATKYFENVVDNEVGRTRQAGEEFEVDEKRFEELDTFRWLDSDNFHTPHKIIEVVGEVKTETLEEKAEVKKAVRKTTKKK